MHGDEVLRIEKEIHEVAASLSEKQELESAYVLTTLAYIRNRQKRPAEAEPLAERAVLLNRRTKSTDDPEVATTLTELGRARAGQGKYAGAEQPFKAAVAINVRLFDLWENRNARAELADVYRAQNKHAAADAILRESVERLLAGRPPNHLQGWIAWGETMVLARNWDQAFRGFMEAAKLTANANGHDRKRILNRLRDVAHFLIGEAKFAHALRAGRESARVMEELIARNGDSTSFSTALAGIYPYIGVALDNLGRKADAVTAFDKAIQICRRLGTAEPASEWYAHEEGWYSVIVAGLLNSIGRPADALEYAGTGLRLHQQLASRFPDKSEYKERRSVAASVLSDVLQSVEPSDRAAHPLGELVQHYKQDSGIDSTARAGDLARFGRCLIRFKKWIEAEAVLRECLTIREKHEGNVWTTFDTKSMLGGALLGLKKYGDAEPLLRTGYDGVRSARPIFRRRERFDCRRRRIGSSSCTPPSPSLTRPPGGGPSGRGTTLPQSRRGRCLASRSKPDGSESAHPPYRRRLPPSSS